MNPLERYRTIIPDWERFQETMLRRDPPTLRVRTGRISPVSLKDRLQAQGFVLTEVEGTGNVVISEEWHKERGTADRFSYIHD